MEYVTLATSIVAVILLAIILVLVVKNKKTGDISLGDNELKKIRASVNESINGLSELTSNLIAEKKQRINGKC